jgi:hypothetical protein
MLDVIADIVCKLAGMRQGTSKGISKMKRARATSVPRLLSLVALVSLVLSLVPLDTFSRRSSRRIFVKPSRGHSREIRTNEYQSMPRRPLSSLHHVLLGISCGVVTDDVIYESYTPPRHHLRWRDAPPVSVLLLNHVCKANKLLLNRMHIVCVKENSRNERYVCKGRGIRTTLLLTQSVEDGYPSSS